MIYVPVVPPPPPSPRTRELADLLTKAIEEYEKYHPNVSGAEVRAALQLASMRSSRGAPARLAVLAGVGVAALLAGLFALLAANRGEMPGSAAPMVAVSVVVVGLLFAVALLKGRRG